ncbi:PRELI domain-containing protein 1, mitochondrial-like [Tigriopus californicus]|uniref:PRELI domain-containing protein 1, mitochondrial-like n=1 Tax=Tigriopus californicus TaxID=6832 RepID=UPI0027DA9630|nr:PRELI domain-containing protein 1, mitochondrial-like [Tigriopus californicus]|eukprot:TCALIF_05524-PA protein Name:"Similar to PRELID1 PRELI domain-containing protein 1, mitochondrial (Gallus gallus)" AED:0.32 eAED:0.32 QI:0/-1/0/1/-1/1/1/0/223
MAKYCHTVHSHPYAWDEVAGAIFQRYPNPFATHVLSEDTVERGLLQPNVLYSKRFLTKTNKLPKWSEKFVIGIKRYVPLVEESIVDRDAKVITTYTRNVGLSRFMTAIEKVEYRRDPHDPSKTVAVKEAWIESGLYGLRSAVKNYGVERFKQNCTRATDGFNHVLAHFHHQQHYINEMRVKKWNEMKHKGEVLRANARHAAEVAKAHSVVRAEESEGSTKPST